MRQVRKLLFAAVVAGGGIAFIPTTHAGDDAPFPPRTSPLDRASGSANDAARRIDDTARPAGAELTPDRPAGAAVAAPDADDIRKAVAAATADAFTKGDFNKLCKTFVDADRDRIDKYKSSDNFAKLDGRLEQFHKDWKAKYGQDFGFTSARNDVLNDSFARITQGEIGEARTASGKDVPSAEPQNVKGGTPDDLQKSGVSQPDANSNKVGGGDTNREPGRNIATFTITAMNMAPKPGDAVNDQRDAKDTAMKDLSVPLIHELPDSWKIDVPDNIDGQRLHDNLLKHITAFDENRQNWPADVNEAYRQATRCVMTAVMESGTH